MSAPRLRLALLVVALALFPPWLSPADPELAAVEQRLIPEGRKWRVPTRKMAPEYITIHSTDNESSGANATAHSKLLSSADGFKNKNPLSRLGYLSWHFTVDDTRAIQHLPTDEQADHADFTGLGNQKSIGIEICVNKDGNLPKAIERAAAVTAQLMKQHHIDLDHVVPHYHWAQPPNANHKACPSIFMDNGKPGKKWDAFKEQVRAAAAK